MEVAFSSSEVRISGGRVAFQYQLFPIGAHVGVKHSSGGAYKRERVICLEATDYNLFGERCISDDHSVAIVTIELGGRSP